ncbi:MULTISPECIES: ribonuclease HII [Mameliella]|uniref:ribonuclease HII n=1 Tax=Mameliella TaxID=1434019 RepID=UPI0005BDF702|nr:MULTISPECIES: ribonuclease HII [Mameliella]MBV6637931.1 ribonuclease HII [Mameliella sp.]MCR9275909.1 ribonuclease HII [Paracoccaceae bacterium]OWV44090.1 ribonuclease HII [Mameliella alba]OWV61127.1 ribonuclease HII [Mameliella alba]GGF79393.1 ribonuclease HII [Mameliella alba]
MGLTMELEESLWARGCTCVAGVDEVGRGPLAGPVVAAAVVLNRASIPEGLNDSKKLTAKRRDLLTPLLRQSAQVGLGVASVEEIDALNILQASLLAMRRAVADLPVVPDHLLIDGNRLPVDLPCPATPVVGGDGRSPSIAAASIVAKTWRDNVMKEAATQFPGYGWETNAGYPTKCHKSALRDLGVTPYHRRSFAPVRDILWQAKNTSD